MANHYLQTAFAIPVTPAEAALLKECFAVSAQLSSDFAELSSDSLQAVKTCYASLSEAFKLTFPKKPEEEDPFADFLDLWSDPGFPEFDADLIIQGDPEARTQSAFISGHEADVSSLASLIRRSANPRCRSVFNGRRWLTRTSPARSAAATMSSPMRKYSAARPGVAHGGDAANRAGGRDMKPLLTRPCNECPWRRDHPAGWLGGYRPEDFTQQIQFDGPPLPCHKTIPGDGSDARAMCAGALIFMRNSCKGARHPDYGDALDTIQPDTETVFAWSQEFLDHHSNPAQWIESVRARMMQRP